MVKAKRTGRSTASKKTATTAKTVPTPKEKVDPVVANSILAGIKEQMKKHPKDSAKYKKLAERKKELMS